MQPADNHLNPKKALDAILSPDILVNLDNGETLSVKPISISTLAVLDSISSPLLFKASDNQTNMLDMIVTLYICLNGYKAALTTNPLIQDALEYFDNLSLTNNDYEKVYQAVLKQFEKLTNIQPDIADQKKR